MWRKGAEGSGVEKVKTEEVEVGVEEIKVWKGSALNSDPDKFGWLTGRPEQPKVVPWLNIQLKPAARILRKVKDGREEVHLKPVPRFTRHRNERDERNEREGGDGDSDECGVPTVDQQRNDEKSDKNLTPILPKPIPTQPESIPTHTKPVVIQPIKPVPKPVGGQPKVIRPQPRPVPPPIVKKEESESESSEEEEEEEEEEGEEESEAEEVEKRKVVPVVEKLVVKVEETIKPETRQIVNEPEKPKPVARPGPVVKKEEPELESSEEEEESEEETTPVVQTVKKVVVEKNIEEQVKEPPRETERKQISKEPEIAKGQNKETNSKGIGAIPKEYAKAEQYYKIVVQEGFPYRFIPVLTPTQDDLEIWEEDMAKDKSIQEAENQPWNYYFKTKVDNDGHFTFKSIPKRINRIRKDHNGEEIVEIQEVSIWDEMEREDVFRKIPGQHGKFERAKDELSGVQSSENPVEVYSSEPLKYYERKVRGDGDVRFVEIEKPLIEDTTQYLKDWKIEAPLYYSKWVGKDGLVIFHPVPRIGKRRKKGDGSGGKTQKQIIQVTTTYQKIHEQHWVEKQEQMGRVSFHPVNTK